MAIDWDQFERDVDDAVKKAGERTDAKLAGHISRVTRLTEEEIAKLFPKPEDAKKVADLMAIVKGAAARNQKINAIAENIESFAGVMLKLLEKIA
jgi:hypothetical protein